MGLKSGEECGIPYASAASRSRFRILKSRDMMNISGILYYAASWLRFPASNQNRRNACLDSRLSVLDIGYCLSVARPT